MFLKKGIPLLLCLILWINTLIPSIISGTPIKTLHDYAAAENITTGDTLISYDDNNSLSATTVTSISNTSTNKVVAITTNKGIFHACPNQQFFDPVAQEWIVAQNITTQTTFLDARLNYCPCIHVETINIAPITTYRISTTAPHTFFVTDQELLAHNAIPVLISLAWIFGEGLKFAGIAIGTTVFGSYVGVQVYNHQKQKAHHSCNIEFHVMPCGSPCPDPDDDDHQSLLFESIKQIADKKMRHKRFGNFYRDPKTKLWWSKDNANHGGSAFKVFKETAKGLKWTFDADDIGHQIVAKHKGPVGLFISYKELIKCP